MPCCVTTKNCPATVIVAVRSDKPEYEATVNETVPAPVPEAPAVIVAQLESLVAVREEPHIEGEVVIVIDPEPP